MNTEEFENFSLGTGASQLECETKRFPTVSENDLEQLSKKQFRKNTVSGTRTALNCLRKYCQEEKLSYSWNDLTEVELCQLLQRLYACASKKRKWCLV